MLLVVPPAHTNIPLATATQWCEVRAGFRRHIFFWYRALRASTGLSKHMSLFDDRFSDFWHAWTKGGGC